MGKPIDVAVGAIVVTNPRTKDREFRHALGFDGFGIFSNCCDNLIACHGGNPVRQLGSVYSYSAASLSPSLALSLCISSSAASAITVPGVKIPATPALFNRASSCSGAPPALR